MEEAAPGAPTERRGRAGERLAPPGESLSPAAFFRPYHGCAITINAPTSTVWSWLVQIEQNRAGFYSYTWLENLVGCRMPNVNRIVPEWQEIKVGDEVKLAPEVGVDVAAVEPGRSLVLRGGVPMGKTPPPYDFTWAYALRERSHETTRLLVRERYAYTRRWAPFHHSRYHSFTSFRVVRARRPPLRRFGHACFWHFPKLR